MAPKPSTRLTERIFPGSFSFLYRLSLIAHTILFPIVWLFLIPANKKPLLYLFTVLMSIVAAAIFDVLVALLMMWIYRVRVTPEGIHGGTAWGTPIYMAWSEMETVRPQKLLGLPYLKVTSFRKNRMPLWIPRFLGTPKAFQEHISHQASPLNPLRQSLENGNSAAERAKISA